MPTALIVVGAIFVGQALLDWAWKCLYDKDTAAAARKNTGAQSAFNDFEEARKALEPGVAEGIGPNRRDARAGKQCRCPDVSRRILGRSDKAE